VASALIEKPARGDFLPIVDGGFSLQYSPLIEYRDGEGMILFCQMDVTGRSESDPAAETLVRNMLKYVSAWKPAPHRRAAYIGDPDGLKFLELLGVSASHYEGGNLQADQVLIVGPGGGRKLAADKAAVVEWLNSGGKLVAIGLDQLDADGALPFKISLRSGEHIASHFDPPGLNSPLVGFGPADVHNRDPRELPLVAAGATVIGDGVLALAKKSNVVFCQLPPWQLNGDQLNLKKTYRRFSFLLSRLLANAGVAGQTQVVEWFHSPVDNKRPEQRWQEGLYIDQPVEWDDPYRFFRW
jgi:hypothetical protein